MACNAISYQSARIDDAAQTKLLSEIDKEGLTQKLVTFLKVAYPDATIYPSRLTTVSTGAFLYTNQGTTVEIVAWNRQGIEVRASSTALAESVKNRVAPFFAALATQQLQARVARWASEKTQIIKAETLPNGALSLKVRI